MQPTRLSTLQNAFITGSFRYNRKQKASMTEYVRSFVARAKERDFQIMVADADNDLTVAVLVAASQLEHNKVLRVGLNHTPQFQIVEIGSYMRAPQAFVSEAAKGVNPYILRDRWMASNAQAISVICASKQHTAVFAAFNDYSRMAHAKVVFKRLYK